MTFMILEPKAGSDISTNTYVKKALNSRVLRGNDLLPMKFVTSYKLTKSFYQGGHPR